METENWQERKDGSVRIEATVYVARPGHKAILIGEARAADQGDRRAGAGGAGGLLERKVHLFLNVKQRAGWDEETARLRAHRAGGSGVASAEQWRAIAAPSKTC